MKKILTGIFAMIAVLALAGCGGNKTSESSSIDSASSDSVASESPATSESAPDEEVDEDLQTAAEYLESAYKRLNAETRQDYDVDAMMMGYPVTWTVDVESGVTVGEVFEKDGKQYVTIDVNENLDADLTYVLTATLTAPSGQTVSVSFTRTVLAAPSTIPQPITAAPVEGVAYKYHVYQSSLAVDLYFAGSMSGYYFKTTETLEEAVDVFVEYVSGSTTEFYPYFNDANGAKQYIGVKLSADGAHDNIVFDTTPVSVFVWNTELQTITTHLDKNKNGQAADYYLGNYSTHNTISASMLSYAGGAGNNVGNLVELVSKSEIPAETKIATIKESLSVQLTHKVDKVIELTTLDERYPEVSIAWSIAENSVAVLANNSLTLTIPTEAVTVDLTATLTCGDASDTKVFTLTLGPVVTALASDATAAEIVNAAFSLAENEVLPGDSYTLTGVISKINTEYNEQYGNVTVTFTVEDKAIECYRLTGDGVDVIKVGDTITVSGKIKNYNGKVEFDSGCTLDSYEEGEVVVPPVVGEADITLTIDNLGLPVQTAYITEEKIVEVDGISYGLLSVGSYGNGIQCRTKNGLSATIRNTTALPGNITKIVMTPNAEKTVYDGNAWKAYFGTTADCADVEMDVATVAGVITIDVTGEYSYFKLVHANGYTQYFDSIEIYYEEAEVIPTYTLTLINGNPRLDPSAVTTSELVEGAAIELATDLTAEGKTFKGWFAMDDNDDLTVEAPATMPAESIALYAVWEITPYTLTIKQEGAEDKVIIFGVDVPSPNPTNIEAPISNLAFVLDGFLSEGYTYAEAIPETFALQNYTFTIVSIEVPKYTLNLVNGNPKMDPEALTTAEYAEGAALELPVLKAEGKIFKGWFSMDGNSELTVAAPATMPAETITLHALWEVTPYTLTIVNGENTTEIVFGIEYDLANNIEVAVTDLATVLAEKLPANTEDYTYSWKETVPATFELQDYTFTVVAKANLNTPEKILNAAYALAKDTALDGTFTLTGTIKSVDEAYSSQYKNITVTIVVENFEDKPMKCYRLKGTGAESLCVADVITVTGKIKNYGGTVEFDSGCTFEMVTKHVCSEYTEATCKVPAACTVCGNAKDNVLAEHNYVEGVCDVCGALESNENVETIVASQTVADLIKEYGWTSSTTKQSFNLDENVSIKINGGSNTGKAYNNDHIRVYATDTPAGTLTITLAEGYELVSVKVSTQTGTYAFLCVDGTNDDISNISTPVSGSSVVLKSVKNGSDGKQVRITAIEVEYKVVG